MSKVAVLPAAERLLLLDRIKSTIDETDGSCPNGQHGNTENLTSSSPHHSINTESDPNLPKATPKFDRKKASSIKKYADVMFNMAPRKSQLALACPVCDLKSTNWQKFSHHLHTSHNQSSMASVCRRCHGMFRNHALLLAHECFRWGRTNLPCAAVYSSIEDSPILKDFGFPQEGVYLERRCGLCLTSDVVYSNFEQYERQVNLYQFGLITTHVVRL